MALNFLMKSELKPGNNPRSFEILNFIVFEEAKKKFCTHGSKKYKNLYFFQIKIHFGNVSNLFIEKEPKTAFLIFPPILYEKAIDFHLIIKENSYFLKRKID
ncbi:hypothetical protein BpHYR1_020280 [Brachionus plicatilis]|uniref:Uncharacterized protein n=1 Tax=Brachionus plicatilis TaxID=10195 RepID=A0A3M7QHR6_BRAPC|nr:hypothetical protein BpHYR1_020280 [Brachionus plicatilis]